MKGLGKIPAVVIVGPTASGKTALAVECALHFHTEVVSADSMQVYEGMDIATAKPTERERRGVRHHLIGFVPPERSYSAADYVRDAERALRSVAARGKLPVVAGGTGLYIDSLFGGFRFAEVPADFELRSRLQRRLDEAGGEKLLKELAAFDPETAKRLHPADKKRIVRAFEVYELTGKTPSELMKISKLQSLQFEPSFIGLSFRDRSLLYERIDRRVDAMLAAGLLREAEKFLCLRGGTAAQAIGYKELRPYFSGELPLESCIANLKRATRNYAKRQLTWFRRNERIFWFYPDDYADINDLYETVFRRLEREVGYNG